MYENLDTATLSFAVFDKNDMYCNYEYDSYDFRLVYNTEIQQYSCSVDVSATSNKQFIPFFKEADFVKSVQLCVNSKKQGFKNIKKRKNKETIIDLNNFGAYAELNEDDDAKTKKITLYGRLKYVLPVTQNFYLKHARQAILNCFEKGTIDLIIDENDITSDTAKFEAARVNLVELNSAFYRITKDYFTFELEYPTVEDFNRDFVKLNVNFTFNYTPEQKENKRDFYWTKTSSVVNEDLKKHLSNLLTVAKQEMGTKHKKVLNEERVTNDTLIELTDVSDGIYILNEMNLLGFQVLHAVESNNIFFVKKLSADYNEQKAALEKSIIEIGNALPQCYIFNNKFYNEYQPANKFSAKHSFKDNLPVLVFEEIKNYSTMYENLLKVYYKKHVLILGSNQLDTYLIISIKQD